MTTTETTTPSRQSLDTAAARTLATTTKSVPQTQMITPRWLLRMLPWVGVQAGTYRVNRRLSFPVGNGRVDCVNSGTEVTVIPEQLRELPLLREFTDSAALRALAERFEQRDLDAGEIIASTGEPEQGLLVLAHGVAELLAAGKYDSPVVLDRLGDGDHLGHESLLEDGRSREVTVRARTACTVLHLPRHAFDEVLARHETLRAHVEEYRTRPRPPLTKRGEADIAIASGHTGEHELPATFAEYELRPREYELNTAQTVLRVHTRVADLYNNPMNQTRQQLRLTVEALRERQEQEMLTNREFGLLHNADLRQRIPAGGAPTPAHFDELLSRRRRTEFFLAHPRAVAAFGRECTRQGIYPATTHVEGRPMTAWRGVPVLPCDKIPITPSGTSSVLAMRTGEDRQGVVGLHQTDIPDEYQPGLNIRFNGIDERAVISYLVSLYFSTAVLTPDALGILEDVQLGQ